MQNLPYIRLIEQRGQRIQHFESLFCAPLPTDATGGAIDAQLSAYMHAVGVAPALLPHVLLYTVLAHAVGRARLLQRTGRALSRDTVVNEMTKAGYKLLVASAPGHVTRVRSLVIDALSPAELRQLHHACESVLSRIGAPG